ncbi:hypothetical protein [Variovorax sp. PCZ-1]|uniref:hypothetical protein n=1 Tax=Variovorax sp. PCZ-1 TaxID=2835533 RepID=UPI001BD0D1DE|nr:hypothetical protein [Variovorax sp. PCZ-1]MBS7808757.1 hypothetical protein [Variovorax sp. PCZ-1]
MKPWNEAKLESERNVFVEARKHRTSALGLSLVFVVTLIATWLASAALLKQTALSMSWRYVAAMCVGYAVFFCAVRIWADFQKRHPVERGNSSWDMPTDIPAVDAEGCFFVVIFFFLALLLAGTISWLGVPILLEVAFEVAFAGAVVRRMGQVDYYVGGWHWVLLKKTAWILVMLMILVYFGAQYLQKQHPSIRTMADILRILFQP